MGLIFALIVSSPAHAGWFGRWCEKHIVMDDPNQFEEASDEWVEKEYARLAIKFVWNRANEAERKHFIILRNEIRKREYIRALTIVQQAAE